MATPYEVSSARSRQGATTGVDAGAEVDYGYAGRGTGWRIFAGVVFMLAGFFNFIDGIVAIANPHYVYYYNSPTGSSTATAHRLVFGTVNSWGWAIMILGIIEVIAATAIFGGFGWAALTGIIIAGCNAIAQLLWIGVYPWWSVLAIILDVLVIYGLVMYGFNAEPE